MTYRNKLYNQKDTMYRRRQLRRQMTKAEKIVWHVIRNRNLGYYFRRQYGIGRFIVDFYCSQLRLIIEIDGGIHGEDEILKRDERREVFFKKFGLNIKHYRNDQILDSPEGIYSDLKSYCGKLASLKPSPNPSLEGRGTAISSEGRGTAISSPF